MRRHLRWLGTVLTCLGLAAGTLAAAGGAAAPRDPAGLVVSAVRSQLGDGYLLGAAGPRAYDCSGLTSWAWRGIGGARELPRTAAQQQRWAVPIPEDQALPGDLAFFGEPVTHVGLVSERLDSGALRMVDASSSRGGVVERLVWHSGTVRFGRVPRATMTPVRPWTPPAPVVPAAPAPSRPLVAATHPALAGRAPLGGLPAVQAAPSSAAMSRFAALASAQVGATTWSDTGLVTTLWRQAGGAAAPDSRAGITNRTHRVLLRDARVGDLVVYAAPGEHVGVYVGKGWMVDASRSLGEVVRRPVWAAAGVTVVRWNR